jgi:hypothetical protein
MQSQQKETIHPMCAFCRGDVFTEPLSSIDMGLSGVMGDTHTDSQQVDVVNLILYFQNEESRLNMFMVGKGPTLPTFQQLSIEYKLIFPSCGPIYHYLPNFMAFFQSNFRILLQTVSNAQIYLHYKCALKAI